MAGLSHPVEGDEDQWEYEYDENETEDFYFTLDMTSHVSDALIDPEKRRRQRPSKKAATEKQANPPRTLDGQQTSQVEPPATTEEATDEAAGELQLVGLQTEKPFIRFNDRHYSCYWATDLGTQIHISKAGATEESLRNGHVVDVIGTSRVKLYGKPVIIKEREKLNARHNVRATAPASSPVPNGRSGGPDDVLLVRPGQVLKVPEERITDAKSRKQASFLERLSAIKVQKGEVDFVPVAPVKNYVTPANKAEIRQRALDAQLGQSPPAEQEAIPGPSALGKRSFADMQAQGDPQPAAIVPIAVATHVVPIWTSSAAHTMPQYQSTLASAEGLNAGLDAAPAAQDD